MSNTTTIWQVLGNIPVGTIVSWCIVICAIISFICAFAIKLYKFFLKYQDMKDKEEDLKNAVHNHETEITNLRTEIGDMKNEIITVLNEIKKMQDEARETKIKELRHAIIVTGEKAVADRKMTAREYRSLHDMADDYIQKYKENSYAKSLVEKVDRYVMDRYLEIIGKLDEHGYDIDE